MELIEILKYPDPKLRIKAKPLDKDSISADIPFIKSLVYTMYKADGVGLAATQVGINKRVIAIDMSRKSNKSKILSLSESNILTENEGLVIAVNPEIIFRDGKTVYEYPDLTQISKGRNASGSKRLISQEKRLC